MISSTGHITPPKVTQSQAIQTTNRGQKHWPTYTTKTAARTSPAITDADDV